MRKRLLPILALTVCLCACERETLTDPVLFCATYNRTAQHPIAEQDAYLRDADECLLFAGNVLIRLKMNADGAIHTAVVTGEASDETAAAALNAFTVLAEPFSDDVPMALVGTSAEQGLSVQTAQTKRFYYAVYRDADGVTLVQVNCLLRSIPDLPSLRPSESE